MRQALFLASHIVNEVDHLKHNYHLRRMFIPGRNQAHSLDGTMGDSVVLHQFLSNASVLFLLSNLLARLTLKEERDALANLIPMATGINADLQNALLTPPGHFPHVVGRENTRTHIYTYLQQTVKASAPLSIPEPWILTPKRPITAVTGEPVSYSPHPGNGCNW